MEEILDKDNESYLDGLLETFGQEPPYETDRRRKAAARAKAGKSRVSSKEATVDSLEEEFNLDDLDDSFLDDVDLDEFISPLGNNKEDSKGDAVGSKTENDADRELPVTEDILESTQEVSSNESEMTEKDEDLASIDEGQNNLADSFGEMDGQNNNEIKSEENSSGDEIELGSELGDEIGLEPGSEIESDSEGIGSELGAELGSEIGTEIETDISNDEDSGEVSFDEAGVVHTEEQLPVFNPLEEMGSPEVLQDDEIKQEKPSKKSKQVKKEKSDKNGFFGTIFHKLFANIPLTEEEIAAIPTPEQEEAAKKEKEAEAAKKKEDKKAAADAAKKKKAEDAKKKAADNKAKKAAKDAAKKAAKKEAELKRLRAEALEKPEGKINKAGAIIIFLFFIVAAAVVIVGTNIFSYDISIADATYKFGKHRYTEAYEGIRGLNIKEKDMELHDKIYTVMFVNKQLNSYNNFFAMGDYSSALDSLIKGLSRYDKYIALARQLGIHTDLDYVRKQIMAELQSVYGVDEREALELMDMTDRQDYSERIYSAVSKLDTKAIEAEKERRELVP